MSFPTSLLSGFAGALALNGLHESARQFVPNAPRVDLLGEQALAKLFLKNGQLPPSGKRLYTTTLLGDVLSNALYFSAVGLSKPREALRNGALLGLAAGVGAVGLPGPLGLSKVPSARTTSTAAMTIGWYLVGGLAAGLACRLLAKRAAPSAEGTDFLSENPSAE